MESPFRKKARVVPGFLLLTKPCVNDRTVLASGDELRSLLDQFLEIIEGLAVFTELEKGHRPGKAGVEVLLVCLQASSAVARLAWARSWVDGGRGAPEIARSRRVESLRVATLCSKARSDW